MRGVIRLLNGAVSFVLTVVLAAAGIYAGYALWDDGSIAREADTVRESLMVLKPEENDGGFEALRAVNGDVRAWLTLDGTAVDHAVVQGETNLSYINTNVYGEFALSGSIFLDSRCDGTFSKTYQLVYGHHMANHGMFGDLELYKDREFFDAHRTGTLTLPDRTVSLEILAVLVVPASDKAVFEPDSQDGRTFLRYATESGKAVQLRTEAIQSLSETPVNVLAMSTCSYEYSDARTVVAAVMKG